MLIQNHICKNTLSKQSPRDNVGERLFSGRKGAFSAGYIDVSWSTWDIGIDGSECSLSSWRQSELGLQPLKPSEVHWKLKEEYGLCFSSLMTVSLFLSIFSHCNSVFSRSDNRYFFLSNIHVFKQLRLEKFLFWICIVPNRFSVFGICANWLPKKPCLCWCCKFDVEWGFSYLLVVVSRTRSFASRFTEYEPKSTNHWIPLLESEKLMLFYCRVKLYKIKLETKVWWFVSNNGSSIRVFHRWNDFSLFSSG